MPAPAKVALPRHEIHVWRVSLQVPIPEVLSDPPLCGEEYLRSLRFARRDDQRRFVCSHVALRRLVAGYLGIDAQQVAFSHPSRGKPALASKSGASPLRFNLSRSADVALIAFAWRREVGVDVAQVIPVPEATSIAARFFPAADVARLQRLPDTDRRRAFMECWTRAEALAKAAGVGIFAAAHAEAAASRQWTVRPLPIESDYVAALAVEGGNCPIRCWDYRINAVGSRQ